MSGRAAGLDIFIGGGADDWPILRLGVVRSYAARYATATGRPVAYAPNARLGRIVRLIRRAGGEGPVNVIGHSWGGPDAYAAVLRAHRAGLRVDSLITLDPVSGPVRAFGDELPGVAWLNVEARPSQPDYTDRLTRWGPIARKPSRLPVQLADRCVALDVNHWDVGGMMRLSGALAWLETGRGRRPAGH